MSTCRVYGRNRTPPTDSICELHKRSLGRPFVT